MRNQAWLPDGTLVKDDEIWQVPEGFFVTDHLSLQVRPATDEEIASLPDPDIERACELLATSADVITMPEIWELMRIYGRLHGLTD